jgi:hypothetical protein
VSPADAVRTRSTPLAALLASRPDVALTAEAELRWRMHRHGLAGPSLDLDRLARRHVGLHAARQLTPWMTLHSRLPGVPATELRRALRERELLRIRCMRRTLHLLPVDLAAIAHTATRRQRLAPCALAGQRLGLTRARGRALQASVRTALDGGPMAYETLLDVVAAWAAKYGGAWATDRARQTIKTMWEDGELLLGDDSPSLHHEHRTFELTEHALGSGALDRDVGTAITALLEHYLQAYGPVAPRDFAWWSGIALSDAGPAWESLADDLVRVTVDGIDGDLVAIGSTVAELLDGDWQARPALPIRVLAYEDPSLKGYFVTRGRYIDDTARDRLFNTIGEARASVLVDGRVAAVWHWNRARQRADVDLLRPMRPNERQQVHGAVGAAVAFLRSEPRLI